MTTARAPWTTKERRLLMEAAGSRGLTWLLSRVDRTRSAVYSQAYQQHSTGGFTRGAYTLLMLSRTTGYQRGQLERARIALNQQWRRLRPRGAFIIQHDQAEDILEWLKHDYWSKALRAYACVECGTQDKQHKGLGLCSPCYYRYRALAKRLDLDVGPKWLALKIHERLRTQRGIGLVNFNFLESIIRHSGKGRACTQADLQRVAGLLHTDEKGDERDDANRAE